MFVRHEDFESSHIRAFSYDENTGILRIEFKSDNSEWEYYDVPKYKYDGFVMADSKGSYAHQNIYKKGHNEQRIR